MYLIHGLNAPNADSRTRMRIPIYSCLLELSDLQHVAMTNTPSCEGRESLLMGALYFAGIHHMIHAKRLTHL
jgi:hypothetical protein